MEKWVSSWRYVPIDYHQGVGTFENITQRSFFLNNLSGNKLRLRLNNLYNSEPMTIEHLHISLRNRVTGRVTKSLPVTLNASERIVLEPDSEIFSDEIAVPVTSDDDFIVTAYFAEKLTVRSVCVTWGMRTWLSFQYTGDYTKGEDLGFTMKNELAPGLCMDPNANHFVVGFSEISVYTDTEPAHIALFGDSITHMSFFSDPLTLSLYEKFPGKCCVTNGGIGGNRIERTYPKVQMPGEGAQFGIAGKDRFEQDIYNGSAPDIVFMMEGINDCSHALVFGEETIPVAADIYNALNETALKAKSHGSRVYVTTVMPFGAFGSPWREWAEAIRMEYNDLIRSGGSWDEMIDLDLIMRDPDDIHRIQEGMHLGDYVHPGPFGGKKMADAVIDKWFKEM